MTENYGSIRALDELSEWKAVLAHADQSAGQSISALFDADPLRPSSFSAAACGLSLDFSKQQLDERALDLLIRTAEARDLDGWRDRLFAGEAINHTEDRPVLHMALRAPRDKIFGARGEPVSDDIHRVLHQMEAFAKNLRSGEWRGAKGDSITDVVNIGIGGSDLGPRMVCKALAAIAGGGPKAHFIANVDAAQLVSVLSDLNPATTLFVITSKTFTTQETMANARNARQWLIDALGDAAVAKHFVAVSTNLDAVREFGIAETNVFGFWDWVGGRYSVWSAVGLSVMLFVGPDMMRRFLDGAHAMDEHFLNAEPRQNLPVLMALIALWNRSALKLPTQVVAPYAQRLEYFVDWLQQLEMESNGKAVLRDGGPSGMTTPAIWGDVGTNSQHAFFQMLHQGPEVHPVDFILPIKADHDLADQQRLLIANALAQASALMLGKSTDQVRTELASRGIEGEALEQAIPHRVFEGNRPSSLILMPSLDAFHLGALMALYEHRTFVLSVLWGINAFDQWGVELGKQIANRLLSAQASELDQFDPSTRAHLHLLS